MNIVLEKIKNIFFNKYFYELALEKILAILIVLTIGYLANKIIFFIIDYITTTSLKANKKLGLTINDKRRDTLRKLIKSLVKCVIYFIVFIHILSIFGINTTGILASAGLISVAVGFGAQSLVKDVITGFFLILEGQFDVGDYVKIHNQTAFIAEGTVITLGLRSSKIIASSGEVFFIPNSSINQVINYSKMYNLSKIDISILIESTYQNLEKELLIALSEFNNEDRYKNNFYKEESLKVSSVIQLSNNIAKLEISVKSKSGYKTLVEDMLKKDLYNKFKERIVS